MKTIAQIQEEVANEKTSNEWSNLTPHGQNLCWPEVCKRREIEVAKASLEKASENVAVNYNNHGVFLSVNSLSITSEDNIVL